MTATSTKQAEQCRKAADALQKALAVILLISRSSTMLLVTQSF